ncbi:hypothetical protein CMUST_09025 [Corynebacterium mustelae]|uniref:Uncharacterized protein n=1 Tax=Corynebacterium mustelae TaxID=571915 RepID=A0A0G3H4W7_9CORY|nr:hypothetical protein [Corynebacterium mustelae]AKK06122.1 hypothetical protein CMUST_09025 [Corynebacterium mustelae]
MTITSGNVYQKNGSLLPHNKIVPLQRSRGAELVVPPADTWDGDRLPLGVSGIHQVRTLSAYGRCATPASIPVDKLNSDHIDADSCSNWKTVSSSTDSYEPQVGGLKNYIFGLLFGSIIGIGFYLTGQVGIDDTAVESDYPAVAYSNGGAGSQ